MFVDSFGRNIEYVRVSLTKQCNFRCQYCMPDTPENFLDNTDLVSLEDMANFLKVGIDEGIKKIRITGGEPLLRENLAEFIKELYTHKNTIEITLTTNGFLLKKYAKALREAGLSRINISLDSLKPQRIKLISKRDALPQILEGIEEAKNVGLGIKLNMVPMKKVNDDEVVDLLEFSLKNDFMIRYIEYMENSHANSDLKGLNEAEILEIISQKYEIKHLEKEKFGPAKIYSVLDKTFGIIAPHNDDFCKSCNRIRITSDGVICPCLYFQDSLDVKDVIKSGDKKAMLDSLKEAIKNKPEKNEWDNDKQSHSSRAFYYTGG